VKARCRALLCAALLLAACDEMEPSIDDLSVAGADAQVSIDLGPLPGVELNLLLPVDSSDGGVTVVQPILAVYGQEIAAAFVTRTDRVAVATALSTNGGVSFRATGTVPILADEQTADPSLSFDSSGVLHVGYLARGADGDRGVYTTAFAPEANAGVGAWLPRVRVDAQTMAFNDAPWLLAGPAGQIWIAYTELDLMPGSTHQGSLVLARGDGGAAWSYARQGTTSPEPTMPAVVLDEAGALHLAYTDATGGVWYARSLDAGVSLTPTVAVGRAALPSRPGLGVRAGAVFITYFDERPGIVLRRAVGGGAFSSTFLTSGALDTQVLHPSLALTGTSGVAVAFYAPSSPLGGRWRLHVSDDDGASFGGAREVSNADLQIVAHRSWPDWLGDHETLLAGPDGTLYTAWTDNRDGVSRAYFATIPP